MKTRLLFCVALAACAQLQAQTNTFPASGNVGVGTSTPADSLDVVGTTTALSGPAGQVGTSYLQMSPGSTPTLLLVKSVSAWGDTWWNFAMQPNNSLILGFSSVPQVVFQNGQADFYGNVGIGTTTPQAALDVNGDIYQSVGTSADTIHGANKQATRSVGQTTLGSDSAGSSAFVGMKTQVFSGQGSEAANQADIEFFTWGNSYAGSREVMRIRSSGSVGIGTTTPLAPLSVNGNIFNQKGFGSSIGMYSGSSDPASFAITAGQPGTSVSGTILGQNWIANSGGSAMQQADSSYNSSAIVFNSGTANYGGMQFQQFNVGASSVINSFVIDGSITPVANTLYLTGGNVGIGTTNPQ
ncbi:MAG TPA: hypothetical protein VK785_06385, partial [Opitutaceae bacterium]|nr:hypothetical protein [Opitutaceae bacterium]